MRALLLALALPATLAAQQKISTGFPLDADGSLRIQSPAGTVRIVAWDRDSVAVSGIIAPGGGSYYGGGRGRAGKLGVEARDPAVPGPGAELEIRVPVRARLWVKTTAAGIIIEGVQGEVDCISVAGGIRVTGAPRVLSAETMDGVVTIEGAGGVMRVRTGSGGISVRGPGGDITASSVGGTIEVATDRLERARLESVTGAVRFTGSIVPGAALEAETHTGDVELHFPTGLDAEVTMVSVMGQAFNKLTPKGSVQPKGKTAVFVSGEGGAQVSARSFKGNVIVGR